MGDGLKAVVGMWAVASPALPFVTGSVKIGLIVQAVAGIAFLVVLQRENGWASKLYRRFAKKNNKALTQR